MHMKTNRGRPTPKAREASLLTREPLLLLAVLLLAFYIGRPLLIPLALAITLNFLFTPLVCRLEKLRLGRTPSVFLVLAAATVLLGGIVWLMAGQLLHIINDLGSHAPNIHAKLVRTHVPADSSLGQAMISVEGLAREFSTDPEQQNAQQLALATRATHQARKAQAQIQPQTTGDPTPTPVLVVQPPATTFAYLRQIARPVVGPLSAAGMVLIFTVYLLIKREDLRNRLLLLAGMGRLNLVSQAMDDAGARIGRYLIANVQVNAGFGITFGATLYAIGIPYATLWGALLGLLRTIPYAGAIVGGSLPVVFAVIYFPGWWQAACTAAILFLLEILVSNFIEPRLYGAHTGISELALLVMAVVWSLLWGWPGLALSTPLTACLIVIGRTMPQMSFLHILLGDDAELAIEAHFYERMLATDTAEARAVIHRFLHTPLEADSHHAAALPTSGRSVLDLYDTILLPALGMAESDRHKGLLSEQQASFLMQSVGELVAETLSELTPTLACGRCPVVCIPAVDQADEVAATMLAQLLEAAGHKTLLLPPSALTPELLQRLAQEPETALYISALPPFAFAPARALYTRLHLALPHSPILVGLWRNSTDPAQLSTRFGMTIPTCATTLSEALRALNLAPELEPEPQADPYARPAYASIA